MDILGIKIDNLDHDEIIEKVEGFLTDGKFHQIATVGPEFILEAQKNDKFKDILNNCDLNVADGFGIKFAFWWNGKKLKYRMTGIDLIHKILKVAENRRLGIFLSCRKDGLSSFEETKKAILKTYSRLVIDGANLELNNHYKLQTTNYKLIFCNFGAPHQEIFLDSLKNDIIGVAMGVGGSFDFITDKIKRAPLFMRQLGLEWL